MTGAGTRVSTGVDDDLDEAKERAIPALGHELGVNSDSPAGTGSGNRPRNLLATRQPHFLHVRRPYLKRG